ncbi:MAG: class I SAM-dependent methyltransferase [Pseudomonadota bacterium]
MTDDAALGFGDVAASYADLRPSYPKELFDFLESHLEGPRRLAVDLGAGPCKASIDLAVRFERVAAVEADARMLAAAPRAARIDRINCAAEAAAFPAGSVDCVIAATAFHWMEQDVVCAKVAQWLRPGGVFFPFLYGPFFVSGPAEAAFARHWALWAPHMDKRLGAKADYSRAMKACGAFKGLSTFSMTMEKPMAPADAAGLFLTASYARVYMATNNLGEDYRYQLANELAAFGEIPVNFPLGGILGVRSD